MVQQIKQQTMIKLDNILPTLQGAVGYTLLQVTPHVDFSKVASTVVVIVTSIVQLITLFKRKKSLNDQA